MIIGICGAAGAGKDATAGVVTDVLGVDRVARIAFAEPLKRFCREVFDWTTEHTDGPLKDVPDQRYARNHTKGARRGTVMEGYLHGCTVCGHTVLDRRGLNAAPPAAVLNCIGDVGALCSCLTPREAMQSLGTSWGRGCYEDIWVELGLRTAKAWAEWNDVMPSDFAIVALGDLHSTHVPLPPPYIRVAVITDVRFLNEAKAIRAAGGELWHVLRPGRELAPAAALHPSETERLGAEFQALITWGIDNKGTLDDLHAAVHARMQTMGLRP